MTRAWPLMGVLFASACFGLVPLFARSLTDAGMAPHAVALFRYVLAALVFTPFVWHSRGNPRVLAWGLAVGFVMGLGWVSFVRAVQVAPVSAAGVLYMTYPVFTLVFAWALFGDRPSWRAGTASVMIILAAGLVAAPGTIEAQHIPALALSLAAPAGFGLGIAVLVHRMTAIPVFARIGVVCLGSILGLLPLALTTPPEALVPQTPHAWAMVAGIGLATALVPQVLYTLCSPMIGAARTAMAGAIELPVMFVVGWAAFGEAATLPHIIACVIVVSAIVLTPEKRARSIAADVQ